MQFHRIAAAMLVSLPCALGAVSCVQGTELASEMDATGAHAPAFQTQDEGDPFADPGDDAGVESPPPSGSDEPTPTEGDRALLAVCLVLAPASVPKKEAFCRSLPEEKRAGCWKYRFNRLEWVGWCYAAFSD